MWRAAQRMTTKPVKFGTVTPELLAVTVANDYYDDPVELVNDISLAMNEELNGQCRRRLPHHFRWRSRRSI